MRINAVTVQLKSLKKITTATSEDAQEVRAEQRLLEPHIYHNEGFDTEKLKKGMQKEMEPMKAQKVYEEIDITKLTPQQQQELDLDNIIESRWVYRSKGDEVRARIVAKGYTEHIEDQDDVRKHTTVCSTPDTAGFESRQRLDRTSGWHIHSLPTGIVLRPPKEYYHQPQHPVETTQSYVRLA